MWRKNTISFKDQLLLSMQVHNQTKIHQRVAHHVATKASNPKAYTVQPRPDTPPQVKPPASARKPTVNNDEKEAAPERSRSQPKKEQSRSARKLSPSRLRHRSASVADSDDDVMEALLDFPTADDETRKQQHEKRSEELKKHLGERYVPSEKANMLERVFARDVWGHVNNSSQRVAMCRSGSRCDDNAVTHLKHAPSFLTNCDKMNMAATLAPPSFKASASPRRTHHVPHPPSVATARHPTPHFAPPRTSSPPGQSKEVDGDAFFITTVDAKVPSPPGGLRSSALDIGEGDTTETVIDRGDLVHMDVNGATRCAVESGSNLLVSADSFSISLVTVKHAVVRSFQLGVCHGGPLLVHFSVKRVDKDGSELDSLQPFVRSFADGEKLTAVFPEEVELFPNQLITIDVACERKLDLGATTSGTASFGVRGALACDTQAVAEGRPMEYDGVVALSFGLHSKGKGTVYAFNGKVEYTVLHHLRQAVPNPWFVKVQQHEIRDFLHLRAETDRMRVFPPREAMPVLRLLTSVISAANDEFKRMGWYRQQDVSDRATKLHKDHVHDNANVASFGGSIQHEVFRRRYNDHTKHLYLHSAQEMDRWHRDRERNYMMKFRAIAADDAKESCEKALNRVRTHVSKRLESQFAAERESVKAVFLRKFKERARNEFTKLSADAEMLLQRLDHLFLSTPSFGSPQLEELVIDTPVDTLFVDDVISIIFSLGAGLLISEQHWHTIIRDKTKFLIATKKMVELPDDSQVENPSKWILKIPPKDIGDSTLKWLISPAVASKVVPDDLKEYLRQIRQERLKTLIAELPPAQVSTEVVELLRRFQRHHIGK